MNVKKSNFDDLGETERIESIMLNNSFQLFALLTPDGKFIKVNQRVLEQNNIKEEDIIGKGFWELPEFVRDPPLQSKIKEAVIHASKGGYITDEFSIIAANGEKRRISFSIRPILDDDGKIVYLFPEGLDITVRYEAEQKLRERQKMLESIISNSPFGFVAFDKNEDIVITNTSLREMLGYSHKELQEKTLYGVTHPEDVEMSTQITDKALLEDKTAAVFEKRYITKDGNILPARVVTWGTYDEKGNWIYNFGTIEDISEQKEAAKALEESEKQYRILVETMTDGLSINDENWNFTYVNDQLCKMLDFTKEEFIGYPTHTYLTEESKVTLESQKELRKKGIEEKYELSWKKKDGTLVYTIISPRGIYNDQGECVGSFAVTTDITELKLTMETLAISEERYRKLVENLPLNLTVFDIEGKHVFTNERSAKFYGYKDANEVYELDGDKTFLHWTPEEFQEEAVERFETLIKEGEPASFEIQSMKKDRTIFPLEATLSLLNDPEGNPMEVMLLGQDITERKKAEEELRRSEERFRAIFENAHDGFVIRELDGTIIDANQSLRKMGLFDSSFFGQKLEDLQPFISHEQLIESIDQIKDEKTMVYETEVRRRDDSSFPAEIRTTRIPLEDREVVFAIVRDISERKQTEELRRQSYNQIEKNITDFAVLVDKIRNPLAVITGIAEVEETPMSDKIIENVMQISELTEQISRSWDESEKFRQILQEQLLNG